MRVTFATEPIPGSLGSNEDFVAATPDSVVLLDGAGIPEGFPSGCSHGAAWYTRMLGSTLISAMTQHPAPLNEILAGGIKAVASMHDFTCDLSHKGSPSATVTMLRRTADSVDWLVLSDSVILLREDGTAEPAVICDDRVARVAASYRSAVDALPIGSAEHAAAHRAFVANVREHRNREGGFWVASADPRAADQALTGTVPVDRLQAAALLSDGASRLVDLFSLATWPQLMDLLHREGPRALIRRVRAAERSDLQGRRWPRAKAFDDATAAYCLFRDP